MTNTHTYKALKNWRKWKGKSFLNAECIEINFTIITCWKIMILVLENCFKAT
jgi:hypothetical protein